MSYLHWSQKESLLSREIPSRPWQIVAADLFTYDGIDHLLLLDVFSKFPELEVLTENTSSNVIIQKLKSCFARHGSPNILFTDNSPQFISADFKKVMSMSTWGVTYKTLSHLNPQSNGFIERHVQTIKKC